MVAGRRDRIGVPIGYIALHLPRLAAIGGLLMSFERPLCRADTPPTASAVLVKDDLKGAHLTDGNLSDIHLRGANLSGANLTNANLEPRGPARC
jgi:hypothetical protein